MKESVLKMTQGILSAMESDEVNSINDTVESYSVALILKDCFYELAVVMNFPEHETLFELNASGDITKPTLMTLPENVSKLHWIKYDNRLATATAADMRPVNFMLFEDFLVMHQQELFEQNITLHGELFPVRYANDRHPQWWTSVDDRTLIFDAYNASIDSTLQKNKTMCHGVMYPLFSLEDDFVPDIDASAFPLLKNKAKTRAFYELKQSPNEESASEARRQMRTNQNRRQALTGLPPIYKAPRYGRQTWPMSGRVLTRQTRMGN